jgi:hypothetical protein
MNAGKAFHKIKGNVGPNLRGNIQRLKKSRRMQVIYFVTLTNEAGTNKLTYQAAIMFHDELLSEALQSFLGPFMASGVCQL